ncbi:MAG: aminotransferase class IV [Flavobacteriaceae bacterium]
MVNFNGELLPKNTQFLNHDNRGFRYGDSLFETIRIVSGKIYFWEDHYLRLMASMRIIRMEIPMQFTMEFLEEELLKTLQANNYQDGASRLRLSVFRNNGGLYAPLSNDVSYVIEASKLDSDFYILDESAYEVALFKDFYINPDMLSTLKTNNKIINVVGSIFAKENGYDNCLLLNNTKQVVEALNGNIFAVFGNTIKTPPLKDGCLNGIIRKTLLSILSRSKEYIVLEESISSFDLQKAEELFITNAIVGIQPVTKYRRKTFETMVAKALIGKLNAHARLG